MFICPAPEASPHWYENLLLHDSNADWRPAAPMISRGLQHILGLLDHPVSWTEQLSASWPFHQETVIVGLTDHRLWATLINQLPLHLKYIHMYVCNSYKLCCSFKELWQIHTQNIYLDKQMQMMCYVLLQLAFGCQHYSVFSYNNLHIKSYLSGFKEAWIEIYKQA